MSSLKVDDWVFSSPTPVQFIGNSLVQRKILTPRPPSGKIISSPLPSNPATIGSTPTARPSAVETSLANQAIYRSGDPFYDLESMEKWVRQHFNEIAFRKGQFIGYSALRGKLLARYPEQPRKEVSKIINVISREKKQSTGEAATKRETKDATPIRPKTPEPAFEISDSAYSEDDESPEPSPVSATSALNAYLELSDDDYSTSDIETLRVPTPRSIENNSGAAHPRGCETSNPKISELNSFLQNMNISDRATSTPSTLELQLDLLHVEYELGNKGESAIHNAKNAVVFSGSILDHYGHDILPQYGLLGGCSLASSPKVADPRLFLNTNVPFSAFICGVQGSGKSHTTACIIENCLIQSPILGNLQKPLSALVFNFSEYTSRSNFRPSEVAFLASPNQQRLGNLKAKKVNVLVSPSNYHSLNTLYSQIPGVTVQPFKLRPKDLNISTMLTLMSVDNTHAAPLYMGTVTKVLREMAAESATSFDYLEFRRRLDKAGLERKQLEFLNQRLDLLDSFLDLENKTTSPEFKAGEITIIDLSCPFLDAGTACVLFRIGMGMYLESDSTLGKLIVLDEAHKYMTETPAAKALTESLLSVIRQQRHYGARVLIATQEPTISPRLMDLCSMTVIHRFSSPEWLSVLRKHVPIPEDEKAKEEDGEGTLFNKILTLKTGEALVFAPSAVMATSCGEGERGADWRTAADKLMRVRMRKRVTWDGGRSIVCV